MAQGHNPYFGKLGIKKTFRCQFSDYNESGLGFANLQVFSKHGQKNVGGNFESGLLRKH